MTPVLRKQLGPMSLPPSFKTVDTNMKMHSEQLYAHTDHIRVVMDRGREITFNERSPLTTAIIKTPLLNSPQMDIEHGASLQTECENFLTGGPRHLRSSTFVWDLVHETQKPYHGWGTRTNRWAWANTKTVGLGKKRKQRWEKTDRILISVHTEGQVSDGVVTFP